MKLDWNKLIKKKRTSDYIIYSAVILLGVLIDQLTKWLAVTYLAPVVDVPLWNGVLHLHFHLNDGAAFGSFSGKPYIFNTISVIIIVALMIYLYFGHAETSLSGIAAAMIASGGIGNMIDRVATGEVVDFIYFKLIDFAIFNGADSFVCIGAGLLILSMIVDIINESKRTRVKKSDNGEGEK